VNLLHRLLNCEIGGLDCHVITTKYRTRVHCKHMYHLFRNALVHVIYLLVSGQYSHTIYRSQGHVQSCLKFTQSCSQLLFWCQFKCRLFWQNNRLILYSRNSALFILCAWGIPNVHGGCFTNHCIIYIMCIGYS